MSNKLTGQFYVLEQRLVGDKGYTIRDHRGTVWYHAKTHKEANEVCKRFNRADKGRLGSCTG
jgi:hypothetical protein